eukprot:m.35431 g.35431  ORF g.35431 m.35431 type:complete len:69 (+) comp9889_c0_seq2:1856-2062(+)
MIKIHSLALHTASVSLVLHVHKQTNCGAIFATTEHVHRKTKKKKPKLKRTQTHSNTSIDPSTRNHESN